MNVPSTPGKRTLLERLPRDLVRHQHERGAERLHALEFRGRRGLDRHDRARHARFPRRVGDTLSGVARADRPHAALPLGLRKHRHGVGGAAQLVGVDRLQVLELEPDVGVVRSQFEADQRRAHDGPRDALARFPDLGQLYGAGRAPEGCRHNGIFAAAAAAATPGSAVRASHRTASL